MKETEEICMLASAALAVVFSSSNRVLNKWILFCMVALL